MDEKEKTKLRVQKHRKNTRGLTNKCGICESIIGPHLHQLTSLSDEDFKLLCDINGQDLTRSTRACCRHFEEHTFTRASKTNHLVVKRDFATPFFITPSTRPIRTRELPPTRVPKLKVIQETTEELRQIICDLKVEVEMWKNKYETELKEFKDELKSVADHVFNLREKNDQSQFQQALSIEKYDEEKKEAKSKPDARFMGLIGPPFEHSRFWLGVENPIPLFEKWKGMVRSKWDPSFLFSCFMVWMRRGMTFQFLSHFVGKNECTLRRQFYRTIEDLEPWAKEQIKWPTLEMWKLKHNEKLRNAYPKTLFFWVDGTVIKMWCPKDTKTARVFYNKKHGHHSYVFFVAVTPDGEIVYVSECMGGTEHDKTHWNNSTAPDELKGRYTSDEFTFSTSGDKAYKGMRRPQGFHNHVTMTGLLEEDDEEEEEGEVKDEWWRGNYTCDAGIARFRAVVERTIGAIKKWLVLMNVALITKISYTLMQKLVVLCCALTNHQLRNNKTGTW
jgi:hypothetical protein